MHKYILSLFILSCGLPDVTSIYQEINQPIITKIVPGNNKLTVYFQAQNNEPAFSGYNIYFGDNLNRRKFAVYNQQKTRPTLKELKSEIIREYSFTIEPGVYCSTNGHEIKSLTSIDLQNGIPIYVYVSAYQISPSLESFYYDDFSKAATPRPEEFNKIISVNDTIRWTKDIVQLVNVNSDGISSFYFKNVKGGSIMRVAGNSLDDVVVAPEYGYTISDIEVIINRLYLVKIVEGNNSYYSKIYVKDINYNSIIVDYAYQISPNILSY